MIADALDVLKKIPVTVASLKTLMPQGSYESALAEAVYQSIRADIEWAVSQIEAERKLTRSDFEKDMV